MIFRKLAIFVVIFSTKKLFLNPYLLANVGHIWNCWLAIDRYVSAGRVVFVDITADWCVTCKYNKFMVLNRNKTMRLFKENKIVAMRGDFTSYDAAIDKYLIFNDRIF